jgi:threonine dehydrogenase-like Zn-dependent dehydrogenase
MRAAIFKGVGLPIGIEQVPDPTPGPDEVVIRVCRCGVCGTDLHATSGHGYTLPAGAQLGHEYAGEVVAVGGNVTTLAAGDHIAGLPVVGCGTCVACTTGLDILCSHWRGYGAALAEYARVHSRGAIKLPRTISLQDGALIEPLAVGRRGVRLANPAADARVLVIGPGPIGLSVLFWLSQANIRNVVVLASSTRRQNLAARMGGGRFVVESDTAAEQIIAALGGPPDIVFEAAGVPGVISRAIDLVRPQGTVLCLGFCMVPDSFIPGAALMKDVSIRFSITYTREDFTACADALSADGDRARAMVTQTVPLDAFPAAFEVFRAGAAGGGKLLVDPGAA